MSDEKHNDPIAKALDIVPMTPVVKEVVVSNCDDEYNTAKENLQRVIETGAAALDEMADIASVSQDGRNYRVLSELMATLVSASKEMVNIRDVKSSIELKESSKGKPQTINQNVILSTKEMLEKLIRSEGEE